MYFSQTKIWLLTLMLAISIDHKDKKMFLCYCSKQYSEKQILCTQFLFQSSFVLIYWQLELASIKPPGQENSVFSRGLPNG